MTKYQQCRSKVQSLRVQISCFRILKNGSRIQSLTTVLCSSATKGVNQKGYTVHCTPLSVYPMVQYTISFCSVLFREFHLVVFEAVENYYLIIYLCMNRRIVQIYSIYLIVLVHAIAESNNASLALTTFLFMVLKALSPSSLLISP